MPDLHGPRLALPSQHQAGDIGPNTTAAAYKAREGVGTTVILVNIYPLYFYLPSLIVATWYSPRIFHLLTEVPSSSVTPHQIGRAPSNRLESLYH